MDDCDECEGCQKDVTPYFFMSDGHSERLRMCNGCIIKMMREYRSTMDSIVKLNQTKCMICQKECNNVIKFQSSVTNDEKTMCLDCLFRAASVQQELQYVSER